MITKIINCFTPFLLIAVLAVAGDFQPPVYKADPGINQWTKDVDKSEIKTYTPGGFEIGKDKNRRHPVEVDTIVQMDDGIARIRMNQRNIRHRLTSPSEGQDPIILITGKGTDTTAYTYRGEVVTVNENEYIQVTSSDTLDNSWVHVTMIIK